MVQAEDINSKGSYAPASAHGPVRNPQSFAQGLRLCTFQVCQVVGGNDQGGQHP